MQRSTSQPKRVLHVLTLSGNNGEYGGPVRVAREICKALDPERFTARIFSGALKDSIPNPEKGVEEAYVKVRPLVASLPFSSLCSFKLFRSLWSQIHRADIVHIHFARDLIPILTAIICKIQRKKYVSQTHGMVVPDKRRSTTFIDKFFALSALNSSRTNFILSTKELSDMEPLGLRCPFILLPNGIVVPVSPPVRSHQISNKIVFCSRLHERKRPGLFLDLAIYSYSKYPELTFEIYGPDEGELPKIQSRLRNERELGRTTYYGPVPPNEVTSVLAGADLMVLPSENEQFPMVVLESLSVGTSVLIMPSCGLAPLLSKSIPEFVSTRENIAGVIEVFEMNYQSRFMAGYRVKVQNFCRENFQMESVIATLSSTYQTVMING